MAGLSVCTGLLLSAGIVHSADAPSPGDTNVAGAQSAPAVFPAFQEQQDVVQQAIEQTRREAESSAKRNTEMLAQRLAEFRQSLEAQHQHELEIMQNSNRTALMVAGVLAGAGLLGMFCLAFFLMRATNRLTETTLTVPFTHSLGPGHAPNALTVGDAHLAAGNPAELAGTRFLGAIEQLEKRLHELEHTAHITPAAAANHANGEPKLETAQHGGEFETASGGKALPSAEAGAVTPEATLDSGRAPRAALLLAKGQVLMSLDKATEALACFDEVIALDPRHAEALVKKGNVLEKLRRTEEALECYDRAIEADGSLTTAYLYKGGVFNRLQRYEDALKCYEQALQTGQPTLAS
jgi:tetratricopeptide (TPR) repeat protein